MSEIVTIYTSGCATNLQIALGVVNYDGISEPSLSILQDAFRSGDYVISIASSIELTPNPNPIAFYEKMIGVMGGCPLNDVYNAISGTALNPDIDTSSLNYATFLLKGALDNDWNKDYGKSAFAEAYGILKSFLSPEQIEIIDAAIIEFNLR